MKAARILAADQDDASLQAWSQILRNEGSQVQLAHSAQELLDAVQSQTDLCIVDAALLGPEGAALCEQARQRRPGLPILVLGDGGEAGLADGDAAFLPRPVEKEALLAAVRQLLPDVPSKAKRARANITAEVDALLEHTLGGIQFTPTKRAGRESSANRDKAQGRATMRVSPEDLKLEMDKIRKEIEGGEPGKDNAPRMKVAGNQPPPEDAADAGPKLTSEDIFGDLIQEIESGDMDEFTPVAPAPAADEGDLSAPVKVRTLSPEAKSQQISGGNEYQLLHKIAMGGMAEVWKAKLVGEKGFEKIVAVKKILPHLSDNDDFISMFIDEAKVAANLTHPNIAQIYELGKMGESFFIAMEFVDGNNLRALFAKCIALERSLPPDIAAFIGVRLCNALRYAHNKKGVRDEDLNIVHRDVSPQNILISNEGEIKLVDFGIAKASNKATQTVAGSLKGKLLYMSPEQGDGKGIDQRSDLFSLGNVLYEGLTGRKLFAGASELEVLKNVREANFPPPRQLNPDIPEPLDRILAKALAKAPENRYASAHEMESDLKDFLESTYGRLNENDVAAFARALLDGDTGALSQFGRPRPAPASSEPQEPPARRPPPRRSEPQPMPAAPEAKRNGGLKWTAAALLFAALAVVAWFAWNGFDKSESTPSASDQSAAPVERQSGVDVDDAVESPAAAEIDGAREPAPALELSDPVDTPPMVEREEPVESTPIDEPGDAPQPPEAADADPRLPADGAAEPPQERAVGLPSEEEALGDKPVELPEEVLRELENDQELKALQEELRRKRETLQSLKEKDDPPMAQNPGENGQAGADPAEPAGQGQIGGQPINPVEQAQDGATPAEPKPEAQGESGEKPAKPKPGEQGKNGEKPAKPKPGEQGKNGEKPAKPKPGEQGKNGEKPAKPKPGEQGKNGEKPAKPKPEEQGENGEKPAKPKPTENGENGGNGEKPVSFASAELSGQR